ncbi:hypothetical protein [Flavobacterium sp.]|uniref:hypothetical protein n=1 Tax=Flavobacterium sp. TaxID=239 RepID=UPI003D0D56CF
MRKIILLFTIIIFSCNNSTNSSKTDKYSQIDYELYNKILEYQKKYPIPKKIKLNKNEIPPVENSFLYIYEVTFTKKDLDTIVSISMSPVGIRNYNGNLPIQVNGIYKDKYLNVTYVRDPLKLGKKYIKKYLTNKSEIKKFNINNDMNIDLIYDEFLYRLNNGKLDFYKINIGNYSAKSSL